MAGLDPAIHVFLSRDAKVVDARVKPGHDELALNPEQFPNFYRGDIRRDFCILPPAPLESPRLRGNKQTSLPGGDGNE